jgi:CBS domain containing-hemolysin-like protein
MISGVLTLGQRSVRMIMTPRSDISWINCDSADPTVRAQLLDTPHSLFPVCRGVLDMIDVIKVLGVLRKAKGSLVLVVDEYGSVEGLVTPLDILEAIAGEFPDADETPEIVRDGDGWLVKGTADLHLLEQSVGSLALNDEEESVTVSGLLLAQHGKTPEVGESLQRGDVYFEIRAVSGLRIDLVRVTRAQQELVLA